MTFNKLCRWKVCSKFYIEFRN